MIGCRIKEILTGYGHKYVETYQNAAVHVIECTKCGCASVTYEKGVMQWAED